MQLHWKEVRNTICIQFVIKVLRSNFTSEAVYNFLRKKKVGKQPFLARKIFFQEKVGKQRFFASFWQTKGWQTKVHDLYLESWLYSSLHLMKKARVIPPKDKSLAKDKSFFIQSSSDSLALSLNPQALLWCTFRALE